MSIGNLGSKYQKRFGSDEGHPNHHLLMRRFLPGSLGKHLNDVYGKCVFPRIGVPQNGWFIMENPIKMDDLGVPLFLETPKCR